MFHAERDDDLHKNGINGRAVCFWSWNSDMAEKEIRLQMEEFAQGRFGGVIIHARAGLRIPYMGDAWFAAFRTAVAQAKRLGLEIYIYDEDGWPSGFASGRIPELGDAYCFKRLEHAASNRWGDRLLAVYRGDAQAGYRRIDPADAKEGDLFFGYTIDRHYVDLLYPDTAQKFLEFVYERYAAEVGDTFGDPIKGVFTDEPQLNCAGYPWSVGLPDAFEKAYGYSLWDNLWLLAADCGEYRRFRYEFWQLVGDMFRQTFTLPVSQWCERNGLVMTGHFACEDGLCDQISSCGGIMGHYALMQLPGIDYLGNRVTSPVLMKQAASVSRQFNGGEVLSETFGCSGWGVTLARLAWIWGWQSALGVTKPCFHLAAFTMEGRRKRDYPAFFSYQEPWWDVFPAFMTWVDRHNALMREGERLCRVLVIPPILGMMSEYREASGNRERNMRHSSQFRLLLENLLNLQVDFEIGDENLMRRFAAVENGRIRLGNCAYDWVFVADSDYNRSSTMKLLQTFAKQGGRLAYVNSIPDGAEENTADWPGTKLVQNRRDMLDKYLRYAGFPRTLTLLNPRTLTVASGLAVHVRRVENRLRIHVWNMSYDQSCHAVLEVKGDLAVSRLTPEGGWEILPRTRGGSQATYVPLRLAGGENLLLETGEAAEPPLLPPVWSVDGVETASVSLTDKNCLTLDRARFAVGSDALSEELPVVHIADRLYKAAESQPEADSVVLCYQFHCSGDFVPGEGSTLAFETRDNIGATLNGGDLLPRRTGWWMDRCIGEFDARGLLRPGRNEIRLTYRLRHAGTAAHVGEVFETERNRFFYPLEPDNVYLRGDFDIEAAGILSSTPGFHSLQQARFTVTPPTPKVWKDLTPQGLWFYRGDATLTFTVTAIPGTRTILSLKDLHAALAVWEVNGRTGPLFQAPFEADLTGCLQPGKNTVRLRLVGTNRNLLGPHHHVNGENIFVGPSTFRGERGFEDFVSPWIRTDNTWTDAYAFVPFGVGGIEIRRCAAPLALEQEAP